MTNIRHAFTVAMTAIFVASTADCAISYAHTQASFSKGANCLFIGHSFFVPVAKQFDNLATSNDFESHSMQAVFAPGAKGTPGALWKNQRQKKQIENKLASGQVELFGMTVGKASSSFEDYKRWIDLALKYNPNTRILIGQCWVPGGPRMETKRYDQLIETASERQFEVVAKLRNAYPNNKIYFVNYGKTASIMKSKFEAGELDDIEKMSGRGKKTLFRDAAMGHGGTMMLELSALCWLNVLYGADIQQTKLSDYDKADVDDIMTQVLNHNKKFNQ